MPVGSSRFAENAERSWNSNPGVPMHCTSAISGFEVEPPTGVPRNLEKGQRRSDISGAWLLFEKDIRKLAYGGAPSENLYGVEMTEDFIKLGYEPFLYKESLHSEVVD